MMWKFRHRDSSELVLGVLLDGTVFQLLRRWSTLVAGPTDTEESFDLVMTMTSAAEGQGAKLVAGPCEFGIDERVANDIRKDDGWGRNEPILLMVFDMAAKRARR